jgi:hypothetical protein
MAKKLKKAQALADELQAVTPIRLEVSADTPSYYVNYMGVAHTPYDFTLSVARLPSQLTTEQGEAAKVGAIPIETVLQLIFPVQLMDGLIAALTEQKRKYEQTVERVKKNELKQHVERPSPIN